MTVIPFIDNLAFNYFASLGFWLIIIQIPFYLVIGLLRSFKD